MKVLFKVSNGSQSHLVDVTNDIARDEIKEIKEIKIKECDLESHVDTYVYTWFDEFMESKEKPFWIDQSNRLTIEIIIK
jgi:hypothetical protein